MAKEFGLAGVPLRILMRDKHLKAAKTHKPAFRIRRTRNIGASSDQQYMRANKGKDRQPIIVT